MNISCRIYCLITIKLFLLAIISCSPKGDSDPLSQAEPENTCPDADGDGHFLYKPVVCHNGTDYCDDDPNNWTSGGCFNCIDADNDGYGQLCDIGPDCDDADSQIQACPGTEDNPTNDKFIWTIQPVSGNAEVSDLVVLPNDTFAVAGKLSGDAIIGTGDPNQTALSGSTDNDAFVALFNSNGRLNWARKISGLDKQMITAIDAATDGGIVIAGYFGASETETSNIVFERPDDNLILSGNLNSDIFVAKFSSQGDLLWVRTAAGGGADTALDLAVRTDGSVVIVGGFRDDAQGVRQLIFNAGQVDQFTIVADESEQYITGFVAAYTADGNLAWATSFGGGDYHGVGIFSDNSLVISFDTLSEDELTVTTESGQQIALWDPEYYATRCLIGLGPNGALQWATQTGPPYHYLKQLEIAGDDSIYTTGSSNGQYRCGTPIYACTLLMDFNEVFLGKYFSNGSLQWMRRSPGSDIDSYFGIDPPFGVDLAATDAGNILVAGNFHKAIVFAPVDMVDRVLENGAEFWDLTFIDDIIEDYDNIFLAEYNQNGEFIFAESLSTINHDYVKTIDLFSDGTIILLGEICDNKADGNCTVHYSDTIATEVEPLELEAGSMITRMKLK